MSEFVRTALLTGLSILCVLMTLGLIRAIKGPRFTDRIVAANMISTMAISFIILLSVYLNESFLLDVDIIYALLGFLAVVVITRVAAFRHYGTRLHKEDLIDGDD